MNAKIPFQDCIEVQFGEEGNIECFKLRKNLTRLAIEKDGDNALQMIKNFEYSINELNKALSMKVNKEFKESSTQATDQEQILLGFLKDLLADFESYDGGNDERKQIQKELKNYSEEDLLSTECTRITGSDDNLMTFRELLFSLFEYAKQKAISISYRKNEAAAEVGEDNESVSESKVDTVYHKDMSIQASKNSKRELAHDGSGSLNDDVHDLPARYEVARTEGSSERRRSKIVAEIPTMKVISNASKYPIRRDNTIDIFTLLQKHEAINEVGLIRNVENKIKHFLPFIGKPKKSRQSHIDARRYVDQAVSKKSTERLAPMVLNTKCNVGTQVIPDR